jgi:hypothetical protein
MDHGTTRAFVESWVAAWNAHDLDALLTHFADDVTFRSPMAAQLLGGDGVIRGKDALRAYWAEGLRRIPDLRFEVVGCYVGVDCLVINYRNQKGGLVDEVLTFEGPLITAGTAPISARTPIRPGHAEFVLGPHHSAQRKPFAATSHPATADHLGSPTAACTQSDH